MRWSGYLQEVQKKRVQGMYEGISGDRVKLEGGTGQKRKSCEERMMTRMHVQCLGLLGRRWRSVRGGCR